MAAFLRALDGILRASAVAAIAVSSALILIVAVIITADVTSSALLNSPIPVVTEVSAVSLAVIIFGALAYAQHRRQNVQVDIVLLMLPERLKRFLHGFSLLVAIVLFVLLAWRTTALAVTSWNTSETAMALITFPVYPFKVLAAAGAWICTAEFVRQFVRLVAGIDAVETPEPQSEIPPSMKI